MTDVGRDDHTWHMYSTFIKPLFSDVKTFVLDTLFPVTCLGCGREGKFTQHYFSDNTKSLSDKDKVTDNSTVGKSKTKNSAGFVCDDCRATMKKLEFQRCIVCQKQSLFGLTHPGCQTPHGADGLISFYDYHDEKVANIIIKSKYDFLPGAYLELGQIITEKIKAEFPNLTPPNSLPFDRLRAGFEKEGGDCNDAPLFQRGGREEFILCPVPLHHTRRRWRGFNQAEILCQALGKNLGLATTSVLVRCHMTKTQKDLKKEARLKNVAGAFSIAPSPPEGRVGERLNLQGKNIILVDDVTTTGATLQEAAKILKRNGAAKVICLTVARD